MAQDTKFGTFGGVFTPSILTILGVIMYLRLPWVAGSAGLYTILGIVGVAHVVSVCTGLSISSIATDRKVGAGGDYYIISRSLGLPIGGALGIAQFVGLGFSVSLYVIGFSESFLGFLEIPVNPTTVRICGTVTMLVVTGVTLVSTALAIKTQYIILVLIAASLVSVFLGSSPATPTAVPLEPLKDAPSGAELFGIFFPAVTGFTAGVAMSGDLRDPKRSIPRGTIVAILVGLVVYAGLAVFLLARVPREELVGNPNVLLEFAAFAPAVVAGIWGATLSSALGSILGAPRILQAVSADAILPRWLARGHGPANEPRNALLVSFLLAEAGVLIAQLDMVARIVSMVFLTSYGFLNISCAIESSVSADFRPDFRIPRWVSVLGAVTCVILMIQLDLLATVGASVVMIGVFLWVSRKQLTLESGDAWDGVWSSLVRSALWRLSRKAPPTWRPHILAFRPADEDIKKRYRRIGAAFTTGNGIVADIELTDAEPDDEEAAEDPGLGVFVERIYADDPYRTIAALCRYRGMRGMQPNAVLLHWNGFRDESRFGELLDVVTQLDHNLLLAAEGSGKAERAKRLDVWWAPSSGNLPFAIALVRFLSRSTELSSLELRFLILSHDAASHDQLRAIARGALGDARLQATIRIVPSGLRSRFFEHVARESDDAAFVVLGLPVDADQCGPAYQKEVEGLLTELSGQVLFVRASSAFDEVLRLSRQATISFVPPTEDGKTAELPELELPEIPELAAATSRLADGYQRLVTRLHKAGVQRVYGREVKLLRRIRAVVEKHYQGLERGIAGANPRRLRNLVNRTQSSMLKEFGELLAGFADQGLEAQRTLVDARVRAFLEARTVVEEDGLGAKLTARRPREDFEPERGDEPHLARFKSRRLFWAGRKDRSIPLEIPVGRLKAYYFDRAVEEILLPTLRQTMSDSHAMAIHLGRTLSSPRVALVLPADADGLDEGELRSLLDKQRDDMLSHLDELIDRHKRRIGRHQWDLLSGARGLIQRFADDVDRIDVMRFTRRSRRVDASQAGALRDQALELAGTWNENQKLLVERARLALRLSTFQHRLASTVRREKEAILLGIRTGTLGECEQFLAGLVSLSKQLAAYSDEDDSTPLVIAFDTRADLEQRFDAERVIDNLVTGTADLAGELPPLVTTLKDDSMKRLEEGRSEEIETVEVPVMRLAQFLVEARLVGVVQTALEKIPRLEARAAGVAQDAIRLVSFQLSELGASDDGATAPLAVELGPVVASGIERLENEIAALKEALDEVSTTIDDQLAVVIDGTNPYDLTDTAAQLAQHVRRHQGERAAAGARSLLRRGSERVNRSLVRMVYNKSSGLLMARELKARAVTQGKLVDLVRELVEEHMPRPEVIDQVPSYYRQLFYGQAAITESFWVGREKQLGDAKRAIASFGRGASGAIVVVGERGSGKTSLVQRIAGELLARRSIYRVLAPRQGALEPGALDAAVRKATGAEGSADEVLARLVDDPVIIFDDVELWWERSDRGRESLLSLLSLVQRFGDRILFVLAMSSQAFAFINRLCPISDDALAVLECGPVHAEALRSIVMLRHGSTGLRFELDGKGEEQLTDLRLARLFSAHFDYAGGHLGAALRSWITHVDKISGTTLTLEKPVPERWELFDELRPAHRALLVELALHKVLSREALEHVAGSTHDLAHDVDTLIRMGLVSQNRQQALTINPFVHHGVIARLKSRGLLA